MPLLSSLQDHLQPDTDHTINKSLKMLIYTCDVVDLIIGSSHDWSVFYLDKHEGFVPTLPLHAQFSRSLQSLPEESDFSGHCCV